MLAQALLGVEKTDRLDKAVWPASCCCWATAGLLASPRSCEGAESIVACKIGFRLSAWHTFYPGQRLYQLEGALSLSHFSDNFSFYSNMLDFTRRVHLPNQNLADSK